MEKADQFFEFEIWFFGEYTCGLDYKYQQLLAVIFF